MADRGRIFAENDIVGEALVALLHDDLKSMGIASVGHRLTILKSVYDVKKAQDIPIESDQYLPLCKSPRISKFLHKPGLVNRLTYFLSLVTL